jgi:hypothetical protein
MIVEIQDPVLVTHFRSATAGCRHSYLSLTPVFINCFNRVTVLSQLVEWLLRAGQRRIILLDNGSTYSPLLKYYEQFAYERRVTVVRLGRNFGNVALWASDILKRLEWREPFVYTDPDVLPDDECPIYWMRHFTTVLEKNPTIMKVGFGLRIDDIPDCYRFKSDVIAWEKQFWENPMGRGLYRAPIDTTLALYRSGTLAWTLSLVEEAKHCAIRTGAPYLARHLDWYMDSDQPTAEQTYYRSHAIPGVTTWSLETLPPHVAQQAELARRGARMTRPPSKG